MTDLPIPTLAGLAQFNDAPEQGLWQEQPATPGHPMRW